MKKKVYMIGNAHIDVVWLWTWQEGLAEIRATWRSVLDRMKEFPDMKFSCAGAAYYKWIEKIDKKMFDEIAERVKEGRWEIVGGWVLQPDCNIPCGESFARHGLMGQRYFLEKFNVMAKTGFNVDSFGHNASLPQILKKSGIENYVFMRPMPEESDIKPYLFKWKSPDGSFVYAHRIPFAYNINEEKIDKLTDVKKMAERDEIPYMAFYGIGNHGGGPSIALLDKICSIKGDEMIFSTTAEYFSAVKEFELPVEETELQHHARGCYGVNKKAKQNNRRCEANVLTAERFCIMAKRAADNKYPQNNLNRAWEDILINQFHDVLAGTCEKEAYEGMDNLCGEAMSITEREINFALQSIAAKIDTLQGEKLPSYKRSSDESLQGWKIWEHEVLGTPVVVFNPHMQRVKSTVQVNFKVSMVTDNKGKEQPFQIVRGGQTLYAQDKYNSIFDAEIEPFGFRVYRVFTEKTGSTEFEKELKAAPYSMSNSLIDVKFSRRTGDVESIFDKEKGEYILKGECSACVLDSEQCDTWASQKENLGKLKGEFVEPRFSVKEDGNVRVTIRVESKFENSLLIRDYSLLKGEKTVYVKAKADFREKHSTLKLTFPQTGGNIRCGMQYAAVERKTLKGEEPCGAWIASNGFFVANTAEHGYDVENGKLRITVLRTAVYADLFGHESRDEYCSFMDMGESEFEYLIAPFVSNSDSEKKAAELNMPLRAVTESFHFGVLKEEMSFFECENKDILISAVKQSEDGKFDVIRAYDINREVQEGKVKIFNKVFNIKLMPGEVNTYNFNGKKLSITELE